MLHEEANLMFLWRATAEIIPLPWSYMLGSWSSPNAPHPQLREKVRAWTGFLQPGFKLPKDAPERHRRRLPAKALPGPNAGHAVCCHGGWREAASAAPLPSDTAHCCQQPRLAPHDLDVHQPEKELAELAACSPRPWTAGATGCGQRVGAVRAPGSGERAASASCQLGDKRKHEAAPAPAPNSKGFVYPNCQEQKVQLPWL